EILAAGHREDDRAIHLRIVRADEARIWQSARNGSLHHRLGGRLRGQTLEVVGVEGGLDESPAPFVGRDGAHYRCAAPNAPAAGDRPSCTRATVEHRGARGRDHVTYEDVVAEKPLDDAT